MKSLSLLIVDMALGRRFLRADVAFKNQEKPPAYRCHCEPCSALWLTVTMINSLIFSLRHLNQGCPFCALLLNIPAQAAAPVHFLFPDFAGRGRCSPCLLLRCMKTGGGGRVWWGSEESLCRLPARPCMGEEGGKEA